MHLLLLGALGVVCLFGMVIVFGVAYRKRSNLENFKINAKRFDSLIQHHGGNVEDFLYGIWQDQSATKVVLMVRNHRDEEVGKVIFPISFLGSFLKIYIGDQVFEGKVLLRWWKAAAELRSTGERGAVLCTRVAPNPFTRRFEVPGFGTIECPRKWESWPAPSFIYERDRIEIGRHYAFDRWQKVGVVGFLPSTLPFAVRLFILATT